MDYNANTRQDNHCDLTVITAVNAAVLMAIGAKQNGECVNGKWWIIGRIKQSGEGKSSHE